MLQIGKGLEPEDFSVKVVPALSKLFTSTDRSIRRSLLENIDFYGPHLDQVTPYLLPGRPTSNMQIRAYQNKRIFGSKLRLSLGIAFKDKRGRASRGIMIFCQDSSWKM